MACFKKLDGIRATLFNIFPLAVLQVETINKYLGVSLNVLTIISVLVVIIMNLKKIFKNE